MRITKEFQKVFKDSDFTKAWARNTRAIYEHTYLFDCRSVISDAVGEALGIDFANK